MNRNRKREWKIRLRKKSIYKNKQKSVFKVRNKEGGNGKIRKKVWKMNEEKKKTKYIKSDEEGNIKEGKKTGVWKIFFKNQGRNINWEYKKCGE